MLLFDSTDQFRKAINKEENDMEETHWDAGKCTCSHFYAQRCKRYQQTPFLTAVAAGHRLATSSSLNEL